MKKEMVEFIGMCRTCGNINEIAIPKERIEKSSLEILHPRYCKNCGAITIYSEK